MGDLLLRTVATRLRAAAADTDVVSRYGGDEFVVLCRSTAAVGTEEVRAAMEAAVAAPFVTPQGLVHLGLSIGVAIGGHGDQVADLVAAADRHMYGVKTDHRRRHDDALTDGTSAAAGRSGAR